MKTKQLSFDALLLAVSLIVFIIETYHGLTTSKPLQLRCFQSS